MSTFFNNLESYGLFLIYKMLIWTSRNIPNVGLFSAYAEVFLSRTITDGWLRRFSLPTQRCFHHRERHKSPDALFSAYAEVFPTARLASSFFGTFLCLRRGVSGLLLRGRTLGTLFSAYAEVFPGRESTVTDRTAFLCLRRGVSTPTLLLPWE